MDISGDTISPLGWYLLNDLISLFRIHPLWNMDAIKQYASLRTIKYGIKQPNNREFNRNFRRLQKLGIVEYFRISAGRNTHIRGDAIFPTDTVLETGYCVFSKLNLLVVSFDSDAPRTLTVNNDDDGILQFGLDLTHLRYFIPLMKALSQLEIGWFNLKEINSLLGTSFSIQNFSRPVKKLSQYYTDNQFNHILEIDRGPSTKFRLPYTEWVIKPTISKPNILTSEIPAIISPSAHLPSRDYLEKIGIGIRLIT